MNMEYNILTSYGHCQLRFSNGCIVSIFNSYGSHTKDGLNQDRLLPVNYFAPDSPSISEDCEVAVLYKGSFATQYFVEDADLVDKGYVTADELADIITKVKNTSKQELSKLIGSR